MATRIKHKRSAVPAKQPIISQLESGELAINTADGKVYLLRDDNTVQDLTKRIFQGDSEVTIDDSGAGSITATVDGVDKFIINASSFDVYEDINMENAKGITFKELTGSGADGITIKAPDTLPASYNFVLPDTEGTVGQLLRTTGSGQLEFVDADFFGGNVLYVSTEKGNDANDGVNAPVQTVKRACQLASAIVYDVDGTTNGTRVNIKVAVGDYTEQNPIVVPDNVVIKGDGLRGCIIRPANANQDMLRVRNACYFGEFTFRDGVDGNFVPLITFDYSVAFDDPTDLSVSRVGYTNLPDTPPTIITSPYIQNCSIISFLGGNGVKIDGSKVNSPNVSTISLEAENPTVGALPEQGKSMVANAFTMLSFGGTGWRLTNDAYSQLVSCFQIFLLNGVYCQSGGYCSITNSATNFGLYSLRSSGFSPKAFSFDRAWVTTTGVSAGEQTITIVGINRDSPVEEYIIKFRNADYRIAYDILLDKKAQIAADVVIYIDAQVAGATPGSIWENFIYNSATCQRDAELIVEAVAKDTWDTGNRFTRSAGLSYYNKNLQDSSQIVISGQEEQTIAAIEYASQEAATYIAGLAAEVITFVDARFEIVKTIIADPLATPIPIEVSSSGDVTNSFKTAPTETAFDGAANVDDVTNIITITSHGFSNLQKVVYDPNGNAPITGLDDEQTYYVTVINANEFTLTFDESGDFDVDIIAASTGTHKFLTDIEEFYINEVISSHIVYQTLVLEASASTATFIPGRGITGTTGPSNNNAVVHSWLPSTRELVVSIEEVAVGETTQRIQFTSASVITEDHAGSPATNINVDTVSSRSDLGTATFTITSTVDGGALTNLINLPENQIWFHRPSIVNSSGHTWEYAGSGTDYNALPQNGGNTRAQFEQFEELPGRVYSSGTNELGDFKVGDFITAFNRTGNITFRNKVQVDELDALRLSVSDVVIEEISTNVNLGDNEPGGPSDNRLSTQLATRSFLSNRLGGFIDKSVSTSAVPGAIVQLNVNGQLNADLIPATRQFTNVNTFGYDTRLLSVEDIPAIDLKAGDISTEEYEQIQLTFGTPLNANDGDVVTQAVTGASGIIKGTVISSSTVIVASADGEFTAGDDSTGTDFDTTNIITIDGVSTTQAPTVVSLTTEIVENYFLNSSLTSQYLILGAAGTFTSAEISNVARTSNVATVTTGANHNLNTGNSIQIIANSDTTFSLNGRVLSTPSATTFTIANIGSDLGSTAETGSVRTIVTSADGNAQGAVTETRTGVLTNVDNASITSGSGYLPASGSFTYEDVPLTANTGVGTGAIANITVTAGSVTDADLTRGGIGYVIGDLLSASAANLGGVGSGFEIETTSVEIRAYVNILGGELFVASTSSIDFVEDNDSVLGVITETLTTSNSQNFLAGDSGAGGAVNYTTNRIAITSHGFTDGDPVTYDTLSNIAIGGLINGSVYYAKSIDANTIEVYEDFSLLNIVEFLSTPANSNHNFTQFNVNIVDNSVNVTAHGLTTGDAIRVEGSDLFSITATQVVTGSRFFIGSATTNSFTLHTFRADALSSINGLVTNAADITAIGTGTADYIPNDVRVTDTVNTSSRLKNNWNSLAATNISAENIISGVISPSRLASAGVANTETFLRGDSSYQTVVQSLAKSATTDNPITLTGLNVAGEYYSDTVIGIANVDFDAGQTYSSLGVARFFQAQFEVDAGSTGQVFIKDGVVDAGTLDSLDSSYFLNPANLTNPVPVNKGGTALTTYVIGDILYASSTGTLNTIAVGRARTYLKSTGTLPAWGPSLEIAEGLDTGSAILTSPSTGNGQLYNENVTTLELGSAADTVKIGASSATRDLAPYIAGYDATASQNIVVNLATITADASSTGANGSSVIDMATTSGILAGMVVSGHASIPANTTVTGVAVDAIYLSNPLSGNVNPPSITLDFTYTPFTLGIRVGDTINIASSTVTNLDGSWPTIGATDNATSFTIQTDANVTAAPGDAVAGTITRDNTILFRNRTAIFGGTNASGAPVDATLKAEDGVGTNVGGGDFIVQAGLGTGNATSGDFVVNTGETSTTSDIQQTLTERLRINTAGNAAFTTNVNVAGNISVPDNSVINVGTGNDLQISHDGSNSYISDTGTGSLVITSNQVVVKNAADTETMATFIENGAVSLSFDNGVKLATKTDGVTVTGELATGTIATTSDVVVGGNLTVNGTTTTINTSELTVDDINIEMGAVASPSDVTADGGGIILKGTIDKSILWSNANDDWNSTEHFDLASGKEYRINNLAVISSTTLGSGIVNSSLQSVGTIGTGTWNGTVISPTYGGTGVNNGTRTITLGGNFTHTGAHTLGLTTTGNTSVTLPTSGTLAIIGNPLSQFAATTSAQLAGVLTNETGSGLVVFNTSPAFTTSITTGSATFALLNATATTVNAFGAATSLVMGAATGTTVIRNLLDVNGNVNIDGGDLTTNAATFNLLDTTATTINFGGAATNIDIGAATGTTSINNALDVDGDVNVDGGDLTTNASVFNLVNNNATTINFAGSATTVNIGSGAGTVAFADDVTVAGNLTITGTIDVDAINSTPIGNITPSTGAFTTLTANGLTTITNATASTTTSNGAVVITGGLGVGGAINAASLSGNIDASDLTSGSIPDARVTVSNVTQHQASITGTGILNSGSITTGFGNINIGASTFTGNGSALTNLNASNITTGTVTGARLGGNQSMAGIKTFTDASAATTTTSGAVRITGGLGVAGSIYAAFFVGNGAGITNINATNIATGTVNDARLPTTQTGKTFSSDITVNGFDIGRGGGNSLTNLSIAGGQSISTGTDNMIVGIGAGAGIVTGTDNVGLGNSALAALSGATNNTAVGNDSQAQRSGTGNFNTSVGSQSMANSTAGDDNTAMGYQALELVTGSDNVGIGSLAGDTLTSGANNIIIGANAQPSASTVSNEITIGNATSASLRIPGIALTASTTTLQFDGATGFAGVGTSLTALNASQLLSGSIPDARVIASNVTQHQASITGTGILNSGSITTGFGNIDIGASNLTATGTVSLGATGFNSQSLTGIEDITIASQILHTGDLDTYMEFHLADQWRVVTGGVERFEVNNTQVTVAGSLVASTFTGNGAAITTLNATNLSSGTVPNARLTGTYSGVTGTGALNAGSITSGFGDVNIGANTFTGNGSGITGVTASTAATWTTGRTLTLTGDVTGVSAAFDGSGNISFATTIAANSVALGTDTTGSYVAQGATAGNGLSGSVNAETGTFTVTSNGTNLNTASTLVFRDASGNFNAGTITAALTGNASTATAWATGRTLTLTGDVTGVSGSFDGSGNLSFATTIAANSVALGTDTTGSYVAQGATAGNGLSGSVNAETGTFTVTSNGTNLNTASTLVFRDASGNFNAGTITAALTGNATTATTWTTGRTITLTGDVTGVSAAFNGSGNLSFATTIAANSVALGTDTTGSYVAQGATAGNGLSGSVNAETGTFTVTSNATNLNTASTLVYRDASGDFSAGEITATNTVKINDPAGVFATNTANARIRLEANGVTAGDIGYLSTSAGTLGIENYLNGNIISSVLTGNAHQFDIGGVRILRVTEGQLDFESATGPQMVMNDTAGNFATNVVDARVLFQANGTTAGEFGYPNTSNGQWSFNNKLAGDMRFRVRAVENLRFETEEVIRMNVDATGAQVTGAISVNSILAQTAETTTLATVTETLVASFVAATYGSGKFVIQAKNTVSGEVQVSELLVVHNGTTASATEYGVIHTGAAPLATYDVDVSAGNVRILATGASANNTVYKITENLITA